MLSAYAESIASLKGIVKNIATQICTKSNETETPEINDVLETIVLLLKYIKKRKEKTDSLILPRFEISHRIRNLIFPLTRGGVRTIGRLGLSVILAGFSLWPQSVYAPPKSLRFFVYLNW